MQSIFVKTILYSVFNSSSKLMKSKSSVPKPFLQSTKIKTMFKDRKAFLFSLCIISYLVQAFFNISVIEVAPLFFISLGLCVNGGKL